MNKFENICFFVVFGMILFGCGSQIQNQAQNLSIRVPAIMSAEQGIITEPDNSAQPKPEQVPAWVEDCLNRRNEEYFHIRTASYPKYDLARMDWLSTKLNFKIGENDPPVLQELLDQSLSGRIVGRVEIRDPNTATLEAMHHISEKIVEISNNHPHKPDISLPQLIWTKNAGENIWTSSFVYILKSYIQEKGTAQLSVIFPHARYDVEATRELTENPQARFRLNQQSLEGAFKESGIERLGRELFAPSYSGIVSFHPEYIELIERLDGNYTNVCFPTN